jgi:hypothetical protein
MKTTIVLHPLPRNYEINPICDNDPRAKYFQNVQNGCNTNNPTSHCKNCSYKELVPMLDDIKTSN